jgi:hypothetical protein
MSILLTSNLQSKPIPYGLEAHAWAATLKGLGKMMKILLTEEMPNVALIKLRFLYMKELAFLLYKRCAPTPLVKTPLELDDAQDCLIDNLQFQSVLLQNETHG